jgi:hypothetical protein
MAQRTAWLFLLCLGAFHSAAAQEARPGSEARLLEIRGLFTRLQVESAMPPRLEARNKVRQAGWTRLQGWELSTDKDTRLRKLVVTSREAGRELERHFFFKNDVLFLAHYTRGGKGRAPSEERLYFQGNEAELIRWLSDDTVQPMDEATTRRGEQARADARFALTLAAEQEGARKVEPARAEQPAGGGRPAGGVAPDATPPPGL